MKLLETECRKCHALGNTRGLHLQVEYTASDSLFA